MNKSEKIRVLVVDDHAVVRFGLVAIVDAQPNMTVIAEAEDGIQAVELYRREKPDVALIDLQLPRMSGLDAIRAILREHPMARVVVLTTYDGEEDIHRALEAGAQGYVIKAMPHQALIVNGKSNKDISGLLGITEGTVKCHVNVILERLGVSDRTQAAVAALQRGIMHFDP